MIPCQLTGDMTRGLCHDGSPCPCLPCQATRMEQRVKAAEARVAELEKEKEQESDDAYQELAMLGRVIDSLRYKAQLWEVAKTFAHNPDPGDWYFNSAVLHGDTLEQAVERIGEQCPPQT